jgi:predicted ArsR family transcriptional regulator
MIKEFWQRLTKKRKTNKKLTRKEQILAELDRGAGTAKQLSDRMGLKLTIVRVTLSSLHKSGLIRDTGKDSGSEGVWVVVK